MPITTNRTPQSVTTKDNAFPDKQFFNQVSWNGLNDNRNIAIIDTQSFNDCDNVFMDTNQVLCSRPAIKKDNVFGDDVLRFWEMSDGRVLEYTVDGYVRLKPLADEDVKWILVGNEMSLVQIEGRCFIFNNTDCWVYEDANFTLVDKDNIQNYIYIPEVEVYTDGNPETFESKNLATDYVTYTHIRGVNSYVDETELNGETVYYQDENGEDASVTWIANVTNRILLDYYTKRKFEYISIATNGAGAIGIDNNALFYSVDGLAWKQLPMPEGRLRDPIITKDGLTCLMPLPNGLYAISLVGSGFEGELEFPTWTNICKPFLRDYNGNSSAQDEGFLNGSSRVWTSVQALEALSYDNYVLVATGAYDTSNAKTTTIYATNPNFVRIANIEDNAEETLYRYMAKMASSPSGSKNVKYKNRADASNTYTRVPICRTIYDVDTTDDVKVVLKDINYQNSQMVAILFKATHFNDELGIGLPDNTQGDKNYYSTSPQRTTSTSHPDSDYVITNEKGSPADTTRQSGSDKLRYSILLLEPGAIDVLGNYDVKNHTFKAIGDPSGIGGRITKQPYYQNMYQKEIRTYPLSFDMPTLDETRTDLSVFGKVGTTALMKNIGFEFMENVTDTVSLNYQLRFFFALTANQVPELGGTISLGLIDKTVNIRNGVPETTLAGYDVRPMKPLKAGQTVAAEFQYGEKILCSSTPDYTRIQFRIRPKGDRKLGIKGSFQTEGKDKHSSEYTGTCEFLYPDQTKFTLESDILVDGASASIAQSDNACILELSGGPIKNDNPDFNESQLIALLRNAIEARLGENPDYKSTNNLAASSLMYPAMDPGEYDDKVYQNSDGSKFYKLKFKKAESGYTVGASVYDYADKVIEVPEGSKDLSSKYDGHTVKDMGNYYIDCWFYWDAYQVSFEEYGYISDENWTIDDKSTPWWYGPTSTFGGDENASFSNQFKTTYHEIPYAISAKDFDTAVLSPEFIAITNPIPGVGATFYPTVTKFKDIVYFGNTTFTKNSEGYYLTNNYLKNKTLKYHYKQGKMFNLRVLDGWVENNKRIYGYINNVIYIEDRRYGPDKKPLLYIPQNSMERRDKLITGLINFSKGVVGIFHENEIWYMYPSYDDENNLIGYVYSKGKVGLGLPYGGEVETLYDGKTICFGTYRGIVGLQYEALTQNEEQILTYLSDNISGRYEKFFNRSGLGIQIFQYKFWVYFWEYGFKDCLVYDVRNGSWWPMSFKSAILNFAKYKDKLYIHTEKGWATQTDESWYLDYDKDIIDWHFQSQELSLGSINHKKRIINITLQSLETDEKKFSAILTCKNFRKTSYVSKEQILEYKIDVVRTYVHRLNYLQSIQFQYLLANDANKAPREQAPLSLSAAIVKYEIGGAVR